MRRSHFEYFKPVCPHCRAERGEDAPLVLADVFVEDDEHILEGMIHCSHGPCMQEYPIIDGLPVLVGSVRTYLAASAESILARHDYSPEIESILGDSIGPSTSHDSTKQFLSSYAWDHYAEFDPNEQGGDVQADAKTGATTQCLESLIDMVGGALKAPFLEVGCATGRGTFELAKHCEGPVLGVDLNFALLQTASRVLRDGRLSYPRRRIGLVYDRRSFEVVMPQADRVDFWICDAMAMPFRDEAFGTVTGMNFLDSAASPYGAWLSIARLLAQGGSALLACPYDWSASVTPVEGWVGGHSQRGEDEGEAESRLKAMLTSSDNSKPGGKIEIVAEAAHLPWRVRMHDRSATEYSLHGVVARKR